MAENLVQGFRLSRQQERAWRVEQGMAESRLFTQCRVTINGILDPTKIKHALQDIVDRHEILRTRFQTIPGMIVPVQIVLEPGPLSLEEYDLTHLDPEKRKEQLESFSQGLLGERRDSKDDSPLRVVLAKMEERVHKLLIALPCQCADGKTMRNLVRELECIHHASRSGMRREPDDPFQYADFAEWQLTLLEDEAGQPGRVHWEKQTDVIVGAFENRLPLERIPTVTGAFALRQIPVAISKQTLGCLNDMVNTGARAPWVFVLACWCVLLQRLMGQNEIVIGMGCDGRSHEELQEALGPFMKYIPVRGVLQQGSTFKDFLRSLQDSVTQSLEWQDYYTWNEPLGTPKPVDIGYIPFCFEFEDILPSYGEPCLSFTLERVETFFDRFKIRLVFQRGADGFGATLQYNEAYYSDEVMACITEQLETLMSQAASQPELLISELGTMSERERHQVLNVFNSPSPTEQEAECLHHLFEARATQSPEQTAVVFDDQVLTYGELNRRANRLAHYLQHEGVGPETAVGVCMERSPDLIVGLLSVLKAGGAYVPIDPAYPIDRRMYLLEDSRARVVVTQEQFRDAFAATGATVVTLDSEDSWPKSLSSLKPVVSEHPDHAAYIIYTSGSTGRPKGVVITHRNAVHSTRARLAYYVEPMTCFLLLSSFAFDSSVAGIFWTLSMGGKLCLTAEGMQKAPTELGELIRRRQVTHLLCLPSLYTVLLEQVPIEQLLSLRAVIVAGESCPKELVIRHQATLPSASLFNEYGPTEGTVWSTVYRTSLSDETATVSIGRPIRGVKLYNLDERLQPVSIGMLGELYIAGSGIARGYHNRPDLTADKFIPDPFDQTAGGRLYRTGDLVRYKPDGNVEFAGRHDQQVKLRGYRIELEEIEARILEHPLVHSAVVMARKGQTGDVQIVAYVVPRENDQSIDAVREFLKERLPEYMVPSAIVPLSNFPLTPNGKIDRKALPMPDVVGSLARQYVAPRTQAEELLAGIWMDVLQVRRVGVHDNFFELGGHSLLATQVIVRLRAVFKCELPMRALFEAPTVEKLAQALTTYMTPEAGQEESPMVPIERDGTPLPLSFAQQRLWVLVQLDPHDTSYNIPIVLLLKGRLDVSALETSFTNLVQRHEVLRSTITVVEGKPVQTILTEVKVALPIIDLSKVLPSELEDTVARLAAAEAQRPFELAYGPLLRVSLLRLDNEEHVLLLTMHHIVSDAWSSEILVREMGEFYAAAVEGRSSDLRKLPLQYADFAVWQRQWLTGPVLDRQLEYWTERLKANPAPLELPMDRPRPPVQTSRGASHTVQLSAELSNSVSTLSRREGVTLFMALLSAFYVLLFRYTDRSDIIVGSPIANRTRSEIEGLIGFFVNTLALRVDLSGNPTVLEVLKRVRDACLGAYSHQDVPFEKVVEVVQPVRDVSYSPLFQVMFELQNASSTELIVPGLQFSSVEGEHLTAKFDLTLSLCETEDGLTSSMEYNTDLFNPTTIQRMLRHFEVVLQGMIASPDSTIAELPLLVEDERKKLLEEWNAGPVLPIAGNSFSERFEAQAELTPQNLAVTFGTESVTYQDLNRRANEMAHALISEGVRQETIVGVLAERDITFLTMILAIFKAGGVYLPLDPTLPVQRLGHLVATSGMAVLLTTRVQQERVSAELERLSSISTPKIQIIDHVMAKKWDDSNPIVKSHPNSVAYVIHTSGSTGVPKGAMVEHQGMVNHLLVKVSSLHLTSQDVVAQTASQSFDISVWQFLAVLLCGGQVYIVPDDVAHDPSQLFVHLNRAGVTILETVPILLQGLLETATGSTLEKTAFTKLRIVLPTGEALPGTLCRRWLMAYPHVPLMNAYGPAECADDVAVHVIDRVPSELDSHMPIGRPIANIRLYVLSRTLTPVPIGVAGELCVAGTGVGRGYLLNPTRTAEVFIPDPFGEGGRLYKTGDMARYRMDGTLEFLGRVDHQVKVRGYRIELGEIESHLCQHPNVKEAAVMTKENKPGDKHLVAYIVGSTTPEELREYIRERLPSYMVPSMILTLDALPRNANGKVDRRALPDPGMGSELGHQYVAPKTPTEIWLAREWSEVLGQPTMGVHDNFFDLGGHSLSAVQLIARLNKHGGTTVSLVDLFQNPTIASLSERLTVLTEDSPSPLVILQSGGIQPPLFCFDPTGTHVLAYQSLAYSLGEQQPVYALALSRIFSTAWKELSVEKIAEDYARIILECQSDGPYHLLGWSNGGAIALAVARVLERQGQSLAFLGLLDTQPPTAESSVSLADELLFYVQGERFEAFMAISAAERQAFYDRLGELDEEGQVEYAIRWAQDNGLLSLEESDASIKVLKVGYALDKQTGDVLRAIARKPVQASIHAWWTSATLSKHGDAPVDWTRYTRGSVHIETILGEHTDAVQSIQVHQRINEILKMKRLLMQEVVQR